MAGLPEIIKQDPWFSPKARNFLSDLIARGEICDIDVGIEQAEDILREVKRLSLYNAKLLLQGYREYVWLCEYAPYPCMQEPIHRRKTTDEMLNAFLDEYPADHLTGDIRTDDLICVLDLFKRTKLSLKKLKRSENGDRFYRVLYLAYIDPKRRTIEEIMQELGVRRSYYFELKNEAMTAFSAIQWHSSPAHQIRILTDAAKSFT